MATEIDTVPAKSAKTKDRVAGRSAATGRFVLRPASKGSSITVQEASKAARAVQGKTR